MVLALVTGVGRSIGIGAAVAEGLARAGWDVAFTHWTPYDARMPWGVDETAAEDLVAHLTELGSAVTAIEADLGETSTPAKLFDEVQERLGEVTALVMCHCESVDSGLLDTTVESFDRHFAVNARATWLLIREYALRFRGARGTGRIVAVTSDATVGNLPYGASNCAPTSSPRLRWAASAHLRTARTWSRSSARPRAAGSTGSYCTATAVSPDAGSAR